MGKDSGGDGLIGLVAGWRQCLVMEGTDVRAVLQGVVTNDVERVARDHLVYAALLSPQGKYLFDFFLSERADGAIRIETEAARVEALAKRLKMYCLRRDARVSVETGIGVALVWDAGAGETASRPPTPAASPAPAAGVVLGDPRAERLGWRVYASDPAGALRAFGAQVADPAAYTALRVAAEVPEAGAELVPDDTYILEAGFERLSGVDFRKGCYVGQEVTARMKHKTELRKGLVRVAVEGEAPIGTAVTTAEGKPVGTLYSLAHGVGLAHLRFDRADGEMLAGEARLRRLP